jgi:hypothetical protein
MSLPRVAPAAGAVIDGYFVPGGTVVSCQAYSAHRVDKAVFPDPDVFDPERWLTAEGEADRRRISFAFAAGGRGCVGKQWVFSFTSSFLEIFSSLTFGCSHSLALAEMKMLLRDVYSRFTTVPDASMTEEEMAMSDQLISSRPLGQRCLMRFIPIVDE